MADPIPFDEDYYVIDEPPAPGPQQPDNVDYRLLREQQLELALAVAAPRFEVYWSVPIELDLDWADED
jgi:hypothetical protein